jgi:hypothetical protein
MEEAKPSETPIVHDLAEAKQTKVEKIVMLKLIPLALIVIILGIGSGYFLSSQKRSSGGALSGKQVAPAPSGEIKKGQIFGSADEKAFRDSAEGTLQKGGLDTEGSHKLIRPGGDSQTVYLTSSALDLDQFVGKKVKVWGETNKATKAGWFMDVGRVEILE